MQNINLTTIHQYYCHEQKQKPSYCFLFRTLFFITESKYSESVLFPTKYVYLFWPPYDITPNYSIRKLRGINKYEDLCYKDIARSLSLRIIYETLSTW